MLKLLRISDFFFFQETALVVKITNPKNNKVFYTFCESSKAYKNSEILYINKKFASLFDLQKDNAVTVDVVDHNKQTQLTKVHVRTSEEDHKKTVSINLV